SPTGSGSPRCSTASSSSPRDGWPRRDLTPSSLPGGGSTPDSGDGSSSSRRSRPRGERAPRSGLAMRHGMGAPREEGAATRPVFHARLAGRVWAFTRPYRGAVALSAALFPLLAAVDLAQPYLVKVAIDAHILRGDWSGLSRIAALFLVTLTV